MTAETGLRRTAGLARRARDGRCRRDPRPRHETDRAQAWLRVGLAAGLLGYAVTMISGDRTILREDLATFAVAGALAIALRSDAVSSATNARIRRIALLAIAALALTVAAACRRRAPRRPSRERGVGISWLEELEGVRFRWTTERGVFHVPSARAG